ncbi:FbpB family small basic protein [Oceanobacillus caeni]|nr:MULTISPECIES: FbpB family small basic protein [Bacillaceae]PZD83338.1 FbpB family small basic protein [Bacilli bacterium]MBU8792396.1 FbpB family small basic protein [Oceanobacillus caeni]MCR1833023.1 FbpB family small basic protein [Oceanobacillus caeni]MED4473983.1 FbpB family small basic protein [Oceanobacillus caeni]PZD87783.1 FbpB family small basic protein [Bacilli bacterium]
MSLKKKLNFEELVQQNRRQILEDKELLDKIEQRLEDKYKEAK